MVIAAVIVVIVLSLLALTLNFFRPWQQPGKHAAPPGKPPPPAPRPAPAPPREGAGISLLVPFRSDSGARQQAWDWLRQYWTNQLPGAQICVGTSFSTPFCKTGAFNQARRQATGDIIVLLDADCYLPGDVVQSCADKIRVARRRGRKLWFIPYRRFYRLTQDATKRLIASSPRLPLLFTDSPAKVDFIPALDATSPSSGHWYGALIQIMPQEAFDAAGGMDERFTGWGGEDHAFMEAVDTLYAKHKTTDNQVLHLWHPTIDDPGPGTFRRWEGQDDAHVNDQLVGRYHNAFGDRSAMARLVAEGHAIRSAEPESDLPMVAGFVRDPYEDDTPDPAGKPEVEMVDPYGDTPTDELDTRQLVERQVFRELRGDYDYLYKQGENTQPIDVGLDIFNER